MSFVKCPLCEKNHYLDLDDKARKRIIKCPEKDKQFKAEITKDEISRGDILSYEDEVFYEIGKEILKNSRTTLREFCSWMASLSSGAIGTYTALVAFVLPKDTFLIQDELLFLLLPPILFLASLITFMVGYLPSATPLNIEIKKSIEEKHTENIRERMISIFIGGLFFITGMISAVTIIILYAIYTR